MQAKTLAALRKATRDGELPIRCDASSCTEGLRQAVEAETPVVGRSPLRIVDVVDFAAERILPKLPPGQKLASLALHHMFFNPHGPESRADVGGRGCGRMSRHPRELGLLRLRRRPRHAPSRTDGLGYTKTGTGNRQPGCLSTCLLQPDLRLGMTRATGQDYRHVLELLEEITAPETRANTLASNE